ncbi:MAG TPA: methyltransferase domain-containing protein [bacterium]|jgi:hypothetical protein|nr:methyltransferase domain-containing protein [bacterium]
MDVMPAPPRREHAPELMDFPHPRPVMEVCLTELERLNRLLGVRRLVWGHLRRFLRPGDRALTVADVATGGADLPRAFAAWGRLNGIVVRAIAIDNHPMTTLIARDRSAAFPEIQVVQGDAGALPLEDRSVDVALFTSGLHHLRRSKAIDALRELDRIGRRGFLVTDLVRTWGAYLGARALAVLLLRSPLTRADGPRSVLRAYTPAEARALLAETGIAGVTIMPAPLFRLAMVKRA